MNETSQPVALLQIPQLDEIRDLVSQALAGRARQAFYTLPQAWRLKHAAVVEEGAVSLETFKKNRALQPRGGVPDGWVSNRKVWTEASIEEWLAVTDDGLAAYLAKHNPAARVPDRIFEAVKRRRG